MRKLATTKTVEQVSLGGIGREDTEELTKHDAARWCRAMHLASYWQVAPLGALLNGARKHFSESSGL
jgi:hypothetical protein